ncbi:tetratricopeptide repeat protein [Mucilaginibacter terrae]|uniref:Tetratricopeptide (TPR) repeat protein n=1 Tax=Mucilaginibacter terrae TaxID=1955052 RepID=A0ABU3GXG3_9SPHI|nr:tetratricopeptide repeat protein [Mucilaginibacter terrae]MDT3404461.1 tetratricopeptide (TPR) repeat protein [Mucilaginibacter terrae]
MKRLLVLIFTLFAVTICLHAQDNNELLLARQYNQNGEFQKAADIYQRLYRQDNETYFFVYTESLINLKKYDEAESITKKIVRKHPEEPQYAILLGKIYNEQGHSDKANAVYEGLLKNLPANQAAISGLATQFYQAENTDFAIKILLKGRDILHNPEMFGTELISLYRLKRDKAAITNEYLNVLSVNPIYINQAQNAFGALYEGEADYDMLRTALLKRIQKDPQQVVFTSLLTWQYLQQKQYDQALNQALALNRRQANSNGSDIFELCQTLVANGAYDTAIRGYEYLIGKNAKTDDLYIPTKIELVNAKNLKITSGKYVQADLLGLEKDYTDLLSEFGKNAGTAFAMQRLANLQAFKLHKLNEAQKLLEEAVSITALRPQTLASCKLDLGDLYLINNQPWEATLTYSQVEKAFEGTPMAQEANYRNAKLSYYTGDFKWAKNQLKVLKAATSQLIANDALNLSLLIGDNLVADTAGKALKMYAHADLQIFKEEPAKALITLDSIDKKYPNNALADDILMAKARILIQQKNYAAAVVPLKQIVTEHQYDLWADDAVYMLGTIYEEQLNDKETAKSYYQKIITDYPGSIWIGDARKHFRILRGDKPDSSS